MMQTKEATISNRSPLLKSRWDVLITGALLEMEPNWVIQIGTKSKFSSVYSANILSRLGPDRHAVISVVPDTDSLPRKKNLHYLEGDPLDSSILASIKDRIRPEDKVMVILEDGLKMRPIVEIQTYAPFVTEGGYLVLDEEIDAFALKNMEFEPDWIMPKPQLYLRNSASYHYRFDNLTQAPTRSKCA